MEPIAVYVQMPISLQLPAPQQQSTMPVLPPLSLIQAFALTAAQLTPTGLHAPMPPTQLLAFPSPTTSATLLALFVRLWPTDGSTVTVQLRQLYAVTNTFWMLTTAPFAVSLTMPLPPAPQQAWLFPAFLDFISTETTAQLAAVFSRIG